MQVLLERVRGFEVAVAVFVRKVMCGRVAQVLLKRVDASIRPSTRATVCSHVILFLSFRI